MSGCPPIRVRRCFGSFASGTSSSANHLLSALRQKRPEYCLAADCNVLAWHPGQNLPVPGAVARKPRLRNDTRIITCVPALWYTPHERGFLSLARTLHHGCTVNTGRSSGHFLPR